MDLFTIKYQLKGCSESWTSFVEKQLAQMFRYIRAQSLHHTPLSARQIDIQKGDGDGGARWNSVRPPGRNLNFETAIFSSIAIHHALSVAQIFEWIQIVSKWMVLPTVEIATAPSSNVSPPRHRSGSLGIFRAVDVNSAKIHPQLKCNNILWQLKNVSAQ